MRRWLRDESGASAAEYALILAIIGTGIAIAMIFLGGTVSGSMNRTASHIEEQAQAAADAAANKGKHKGKGSGHVPPGQAGDPPGKGGDPPGKGDGKGG